VNSYLVGDNVDIEQDGAGGVLLDTRIGNFPGLEQQGVVAFIAQDGIK